jgi:hypothetical protein
VNRTTGPPTAVKGTGRHLPHARKPPSDPLDHTLIVHASTLITANNCPPRLPIGVEEYREELELFIGVVRELNGRREP